MFTVTLYTLFAKPTNSTATPGGSGRDVSVHSYASLDILNPVLLFDLGGGAAYNPHSYNYAHITAFGRWYYIKTWECVDGLWKAYLAVDALASWKSTIGQQRVYVLRSSEEYDGHIVDSMYPATNVTQIYSDMLTNPWRSAIESTNGGMWVLGITGRTYTTYYVMTYAGLTSFLSGLFSNDYYSDVLTAFDIAMYPETKIAVDPLQYVSSCKWYPFTFDSVILTPVTEIQVGMGTVAVSNCYKFTSQAHTMSFAYTIYPDDHPQAAARGAYLNAAPYSSYHLSVPPFGLIALDANIVANSVSLLVVINVDARTGMGMLVVSAEQGYGTDRTYEIITQSSAPIGVSFPLSAVQRPGFGAGMIMNGIASAAAGAMSGNITGVISGGLSMIKEAVYNDVPHLSSVPGVGSVAALLIGFGMMYEFHEIVDEDLENRGRPLCQIRQINTLGGYIMCSDPDIELPCTDAERAVIVSALTGGFHYA